jgi:YD repeat-containing protein
VQAIAFNEDEIIYSINERDIKGRVKRMTQWVGSDSFVTDYAYTSLDQLQKETLPQLGGTFNTFYDYYGTGEVSGDASPGASKSVAVRDGTQDVVKQSYSYNDSGKRLHSITSPNGTFTYDYRPGTDLVQSINGPGLVTTRNYESDTGRLASISVSSNNQLRYSASFKYNDNDQRVAADIIVVQPDGSSKTEHWEYDYDDQDQLIFAMAYDESGTATKEFNYTFDAVGNDLAYEPNALNQYTVGPLTENEITYDPRGNLTYDGTFSYSYNAQDRVIEAHDAEHRATYGYDAQGRRIWRKSYDWDSSLNGGSGGWNLQRTLTFAYDGWRLMAEFELQPDESQRLIRSYAWGLDLSGTLEGAGGIGGLLSVTVYASNGTPTTYQVVHDGNGNEEGQPKWLAFKDLSIAGGGFEPPTSGL